MAADTWCSIQLAAGTAAADKMKHQIVSGSPANGDCAFGFDHTKLTTLNQANAVLDIVKAWLLGAGFK
jgi:hypothetical protein